MSENNQQKDYVKFLDRTNPEEDIYVNFTFNVQVNDSLLMFHICHLYYNCLILIEEDEMSEDEIDSIMTFNYILKSVQETLDNRIRCLSSSYIDDAYQWCLERPNIFDICLDYFNKIKNEVKSIEQTYAVNKLLQSKDLIEKEQQNNKQTNKEENVTNINKTEWKENSTESEEDCYC